MMHDLPSNPSAELLEVAGPDLYATNAFRVLELTAEASPREVRRQAEILLRAGRAPRPGPLALAAAPGEDAIREARDRLLRDPERRLVAEMFWFRPRDESDEGVAALVGGDVERARSVWAARGHIDNLAVLWHVRALDLERGGTVNGGGELATCWQAAYEHWVAVQDSDGYWDALRERIAEIDDPRLTTGLARRMRATLPLALLSINARMAVRAAQDGNTADARRHVAIIAAAGFGDAARDEALRRALETVRERIKSPCDAAIARLRADTAQGLEICEELLGVTEQPLAVLECLADGPGRSGAAGALLDTLREEIALALRLCSIGYANATQDWLGAHRFLQTAASEHARTPSTRSQLVEDLRIVEANIKASGGRVPKAPRQKKPPKAAAPPRPAKKPPKVAAPHRPPTPPPPPRTAPVPVPPPAPRTAPAPAPAPWAAPAGAPAGGAAAQDESPGVCGFCRRDEGVQGLEVNVDMHGEVTGQGAAMTWEEGQMPVSRCESCALFHRNLGLARIPGIVFWIAAAAAVALAATSSAGVIALVTALTLIWIARLGIGWWLLGDYGPRSGWPRRITDTNEYPPIRALAAQGWHPGTRPAATER